MRTEVSNKAMLDAMDKFMNKLLMRMNEKGLGTFASRHEALGSITEEYIELVDAVRSNSTDEFEQEILDIMVGCFWALASKENNSLDW